VIGARKHLTESCYFLYKKKKAVTSMLGFSEHLLVEWQRKRTEWFTKNCRSQSFTQDSEITTMFAVFTGRTY
jgi:hypothetical protein